MSKAWIVELIMLMASEKSCSVTSFGRVGRSVGISVLGLWAGDVLT